jgi:hypothetical protein
MQSPLGSGRSFGIYNYFSKLYGLKWVSTSIKKLNWKIMFVANAIMLVQLNRKGKMIGYYT